jgi:hypothetical protein
MSAFVELLGRKSRGSSLENQEGLGKLKNHLIGSQTHDLLARSIVP